MKNNIRLFERKEFKYLLTARQYEVFRKTVSDQIIPDEYPRYTICNVYMDTPDYKLIRRSIEKPAYKEKMRLRSYGTADEDQKVFIELKKKYNGIVYKRRVKMALNEALSFIDGTAVCNGHIEREIEYFLKYYEGIAPAMFISYEREAYSARENAELRITFDNNIIWREDDVSLSSNTYGHHLLDDGHVLMEIKCADAMPLWLAKALSENQIYKTSFSKYGKAYVQRSSCTEQKVVGF